MTGKDRYYHILVVMVALKRSNVKGLGLRPSRNSRSNAGESLAASY